MNKVYLIGRLTKDPEFTTTTNNISVAKFTLAIHRKFASANGEKEVDFINCVGWRTTADTINKYCKKGEKLAVVGTLQVRSYDKTDGTKVYVTEVIVEEFEFLSTKKADEEQSKLIEIDENKLPF